MKRRLVVRDHQGRGETTEVSCFLFLVMFHRHFEAAAESRATVPCVQGQVADFLQSAPVRATHEVTATSLEVLHVDHQLAVAYRKQLKTMIQLIGESGTSGICGRLRAVVVHRPRWVTCRLHPGEQNLLGEGRKVGGALS
jgi:hypothetical protein